jgi:hypothetical protein
MRTDTIYVLRLKESCVPAMTFDGIRYAEEISARMLNETHWRALTPLHLETAPRDATQKRGVGSFEFSALLGAE